MVDLHGSLQERFEAKFVPEPNTGCFVWTASLSGDGYGRLLVNRKVIIASRISWMLYRPDLPIGDLHVLHRCDNRMCVNPDHLFLGTNHDNCMDKARKGRVPQSKLSPEKVREARSSRATGQQSIRALSRQYGVDEATMRAVLNGKAWAHVQ